MAQPRSAATATCSIQTLEPLVRTLRRLGVDVRAVLAAQDLAPADLDDPDLRIPVPRSLGVWRAAYDAAGDPALGLRVVEDLEMERFSLFAYLSATSETPRGAFERATRYARITHDQLDFELIEKGPLTICRTGLSGHQRSRSESEFAVGMMVRFAPFVAGDAVQSTAWFRHREPDYAEEVERVFGCPVRYEQRFDAIVGDSEGLDRPLPRSDSALCALLEEHAASLLARVPQPAGFTDRVRERISGLLPRGEASAEGVAAAMGISPRTLRRRLAEAGTGYQQVLDEVRFGMAESALAERGLSVNEVAFLLGYSDASAFHKAFRRWTGRSPGSYARAARAQRGGRGSNG